MLTLLPNEKHNRLTIIRRISEETGYVLCRCDCGKEKVLKLHSVQVGSTKSCGCYKEDLKKAIKELRKNFK